MGVSIGNEVPCPLCQKPSAKWDAHDRYECDICGTFELSRELRIEKLEGARHRGDLSLFAALTAATKQENFFRKRDLKLTLENYASYADAHRWITVSQKLHKVLEVAHKRSGHFGAVFELNWSVDYPLFDANSSAEGQALVLQIHKSGLTNSRHIQDKKIYEISGKGWEVLEPIQAGGMPGRCFVAMAFDSELNDAYYQGIKPAIVDCGYEPICLKEIGTNDNVCDLILSELRKAQFVVADFTKQKGGVYFEAGFGKALGKEVFWTCHADDFDHLHFDTNHYGHIKWVKPEDLRTQLTDRIMAELGRGPR
jgi:hypothetical protein